MENSAAYSMKCNYGKFRKDKKLSQKILKVRGLFKKFPNFLYYARMLLRIDTVQVVADRGILFCRTVAVIAVSS
jgi:hypothetical protein